MNWTAIEDALWDWVKAATGLADANIVWAQQGAPRVAPPFVTLRIDFVRTLGRDGMQVIDNPGGDPGEEVLLTVRGQRLCQLTIQAVSTTALGASAAVAMLEQVIAASKLPSRVTALNDAKVGIADFDTVQSMDAVVGAGTEPRATVSCRFFTTAETSETGTYVESIEADGSGELAGIQAYT